MTLGRQPVTVAVIGLLSLAAGLYLLAPSEIGFTPSGVVRGVAGQLATTLPAAVLVLAATAVNVAAGAAVVRLIRGVPFDALGDLVLAGLVAAILVDLALVMSLGSVGLFVWPVIGLVQLSLIAAGYRAGPLLSLRRRPRLGVPGVPWLLVIVVWAMPVVLQLASPVVPFLDVLPNHVAPVEHLRLFGGFETLSTSPSPIYGPSRLFLGYVALLGTLTTLTGLPAGTAVAAFVLPLTVMLAVAAHRTATDLFGRGVGYWALLTVPLSVVFLRLPDARGSVLVFVPLAWTVSLVVGARPERDGRRAACLAGALGATFLVHPLIGALAATATAGLTLAIPERFARFTVAGLFGAAFVAAPQAAIMVGLTLPPWAGLVAVPLAWTVGWAVSGVRLAFAPARPLVAAAALLALLVYAPHAVPGGVNAVSGVLGQFPVLAIGAVFAVSTAWRSGRWPLVVAAFGALALAAGLTSALPEEPLFVQSLRYEVPKTLAYWASWFLAIPAAAGLRQLWLARGWPGSMGPVLVIVFVAAASLPLRDDPVGLTDHKEYRYAESAAVALHHAERGYWQGYADPRSVIDADEQTLVAVLRQEHAAGRLTGASQVLHVAAGFQQWQSTPLGVFGGVIETDATLNPESSIHTAGGRLRHVDELPALLDEDFAYVVLEPQGLPRDVRPDVEAAGFRSIFTNARGEIFRREG